MSLYRTIIVTLSTLILLLFAHDAAAGAMPPVVQTQQVEWRAHWKPTRAADALPALQIEVCESCALTRADLSAINKAYAIAAFNAGYRIDALSVTPVKILETGTMANGAPFARGETNGMWFKVGNPRPGESIGAVAGRITFAILSKSR